MQQWKWSHLNAHTNLRFCRDSNLPKFILSWLVFAGRSSDSGRESLLPVQPSRGGEQARAQVSRQRRQGLRVRAERTHRRAECQVSSLFLSRKICGCTFCTVDTFKSCAFSGRAA